MSGLEKIDARMHPIVHADAEGYTLLNYKKITTPEALHHRVSTSELLALASIVSLHIRCGYCLRCQHAARTGFTILHLIARKLP